MKSVFEKLKRIKKQAGSCRSAFLCVCCARFPCSKRRLKMEPMQAGEAVSADPAAAVRTKGSGKGVIP